MSDRSDVTPTDPTRAPKNPAASQNPIRAYISYRHSDASELASWLYEQLTGVGVDVWMDRASLRPGQDWKRAIEQAIHNADVMLAVLSHDGRKSEWVSLDHEYARTLGTRCFPVLAQPDVPVPVYFQHLVWTDLSDPAKRQQTFAPLISAIQSVGRKESRSDIEQPSSEPAPIQAALAFAYRAVLGRRVAPDKLLNLESYPWQELLKDQNLADLDRSLPQQSPPPLWEAWIRATKPREVTALEKALGAAVQRKSISS